MASTLTRAKPNCFVHLHMANKKLRLGQRRDEILHQWQSPKLVKALGMGDAEAGAVVNLLCHMSKSALDTLSGAAARFGMVKGPVSHAGLASHAFRLGFRPDVVSPEWASHLTNTEAVINLMCERLVKDFAELPPSLRKSAGPSEVEHYQRICAAWLYSQSLFAERVPSSVGSPHIPSLISAFMLKGLDQWLRAVTDECPTPLELKSVPEYGAVLQKLDYIMEQEVINRAAQLRQQVLAATFEEVSNQMNGDRKKLLSFFEACKQQRESIQDRIISYKRRRYLKGREAVKELMANNICVINTELMNGMAELGGFKTRFDGQYGTNPPLVSAP